MSDYPRCPDPKCNHHIVVHVTIEATETAPATYGRCLARVDSGRVNKRGHAISEDCGCPGLAPDEPAQDQEQDDEAADCLEESLHQ